MVVCLLCALVNIVVGVVLLDVILPVILLQLINDGCWWLDPKRYSVGTDLGWAGLQAWGHHGLGIIPLKPMAQVPQSPWAAPGAHIFVQGGLSSGRSNSRVTREGAPGRDRCGGGVPF